MYRFFASLILCSFSLIAKTNPIVVPLETVKSLPSLYLSDSPWSGDISSKYKKDLLHVLQHDIEDSYHFDFIPGHLDIEPLLQGVQTQSKELPAFKADFVLLPKIEKKEFTLKLFEPRFQTTTFIGKIALTENFEEDQKALHALFDQVHLKIFHQHSIANSKILYCQKIPNGEDDWISDIYEIAATGGTPKKLTSSQNYLITPIIIPKTQNGSAYDFIYVSYEQGQPKIYKKTKDKAAEPLISMRGNQLLPTFSPKGDKIAFICDASGKTDLFFQPFHPSKGPIGKPVQLFSKINTTQASPTFSPCGSKIAFVSDKDGNPKVFILDLIEAVRYQRTPQVRPLSAHHKESTSPSWSPDGKKIAFSAPYEGYRQIWVYDLEKQIEAPLTKGAPHKENPSWAADSIHLVYNTTGQESQIYTIDIVKQKPVKLTNGEGIAHFPSWEQR